MRLLLVSYFYSHKDSTGALRPKAIAKYLPKNGIDVSVLTYQVQKESITYDSDFVGVKDITRDTVPNFEFYAWRIFQKVCRLIGCYRGSLDYWRNNILKHADEIIAHTKPDAIFASYPPIEALEIGSFFSEKFGIPLISDFRDGLLFEPLEKKLLLNRVAHRHYQEIEAKIMEISSLTLTVSEPISAYFRQQYPSSNVMTLHNGFDPDDIAPDMSIVLSPDVLNIVHTGRLGASRTGTSGRGKGVDAVNKALHLLLSQNPEALEKLQIHFVGQLSEYEKKCLTFWVDRGKIKLWGHQPRAKALGFQRKADILLLITAPGQTSVATGKIFEYLAANKIILALTKGTEAERIITSTGTGILAPPDDPEQIAAAIQLVVDGQRTLGINRNSSIVDGFSRSKQMQILSSRLIRVLAG